MSIRSLKLSGVYHILLTHYELPDLLNERFRLFVCDIIMEFQNFACNVF